MIPTIIGVAIGVSVVYGTIKTSIVLWNKNLERHVHELNRCMDNLINSPDYKTNLEKQDLFREMSVILQDYLSKKKSK